MVDYVSRIHDVCQLRCRLCTEALIKAPSLQDSTLRLCLYSTFGKLRGQPWHPMKYCSNRRPKYGTLSKICIQRTEIVFSTVEKKRLYVCLNLFSCPKIICCQHTLHQYAYPSTEEIVPGTFGQYLSCWKITQSKTWYYFCAQLYNAVCSIQQWAIIPCFLKDALNCR